MDDTDANLPPAAVTIPTLTEESFLTLPEVADSHPEGKLRKALHAAKYALQSAVVTAELLPITNEGSRYGALAATELMTRNPAVGAAVLGGSTLLVEGAGALAASDLITTETSNRLFEWVNRKLGKAIPTNAKMSKPVEAAVTLYAGVPSAMLLKQRENPERTSEEARRDGLIKTAWVAGVCAVEGAAISEGLGNYTDPKKLAAALVAVGLFTALPSWVKRRLERENASEKPRYDLEPKELHELEQELVQKVKKENPGEAMVGVWIKPTSKFANFVRTHEAKFFPEVQAVSEEDEKNTMFLALVDARSSSNRIVHAATITGVDQDNIEGQVVKKPDQDPSTTGLYTVDSLIELGNFSAQEFHDYYTSKKIDLGKCISVETNFRVGETAEKFHGFKTSDIAYLLFFKMLAKRKPTLGASAVFATINKASADSFKRVGLTYHPLMGREDLKTPESVQGRDSLPVAIPYDKHNKDLFESMNVSLPETIV